MRVARAVTRQLAHCRMSALSKLSETRSRPWVLCCTLCECVSVSASALGRPSSGVAWLPGKGGIWAPVDCADQTDGRGLALVTSLRGRLGGACPDRQHLCLRGGLDVDWRVWELSSWSVLWEGARGRPGAGGSGFPSCPGICFISAWSRLGRYLGTPAITLVLPLWDSGHMGRAFFNFHSLGSVPQVHPTRLGLEPEGAAGCTKLRAQAGNTCGSVLLQMKQCLPLPSSSSFLIHYSCSKPPITIKTQPLEPTEFQSRLRHGPAGPLGW